ncbi:MAG: clostripain-related cysteine peptidase [Firmicutes bacterium]|nr:clostripain-related cysteine peptidase [Bacillota bacterium]
MSINSLSALNLNPPAIKPDGVSSSPAINVIAHIDATEPTVEAFLASRIDDFEKAKAESGDQLEVTARLHRAGSSAYRNIMDGVETLGFLVAAPLTGYILGGAAGFAAGGILDAGMIALGVARQGMQKIISGREQGYLLKESAWKGARTYYIEPDKTDGFDTKPTDIKPNELKPGVKELGSFIGSGLKKYPSSTGILYLAGHGQGYKSIASMPVTDLKKAIEIAADESGKKPDIILMESCLMGNMEALSELRDSAKVAIVSEETIGAASLPLKDILNDAAKNGGTPEEIAGRIIEKTAETRFVDTLAAINLEKTGPFVESTGKLGDLLSGEIASGKKAEIRNAVKQAMKFPMGRMQFLDRMMTNFSDLGSFLKAIEKADLSQETKNAAMETYNKMQETIILQAVKSKYGEADGISFLAENTPRKDNAPGKGSYNELNIPSGWKNFINNLWK